MGVQVEEEWRYKKVRSERASKSAFAYKINQRLQKKDQRSMSYGYGGMTPYSREVIVKITGGARSQKGIRGAVQYLTQEGQLELTDSHGIRYKTQQEIDDAIHLVQSHVVHRKNSDKKEEKLTHNLMFSASTIAGVTKDDMQQAVMKTLREKYPHNYFVCAYHEDTKKPHVHVVLNIHQDNGKKIDIKNKDFHDLRRNFCQRLVDQGYDLKASRRYEDNRYHLQAHDQEALKRNNRNVYEVVEFGSESYKADQRNCENYYLIYKTSHNKQVTVWGKELMGEILKNKIRVGDSIKIAKTGHTTIKVPVYGDNRQTILFWKEAKRNSWQIEKIGCPSQSSEIKHPSEVTLDSPAQAEKQWNQKEKFKQEKELMLKKQDDFSLKIVDKRQHKPPSHKFKF